MWQSGGTNYGAMNGPARSTKVPQVVWGGPPTAAIIGPGGPSMGGGVCSMTLPLFSVSHLLHFI